MNTCMKLLLSLIAISCLHHASFPKIITFDQEQDYSFASNSKFKASAGWSFDDQTAQLISPEKDLLVYFIEKPFTQPVEDLALQAWKSIHHDFAYKVLQKVVAPVEDAWEHQYSIMYDVPAKENRLVGALINVFNNIAYITLLDGSTDGLSKRGAQLNIALRSWKPNDFKKEDLSQNKPKIFSATHAHQLEAFMRSSMQQLKVPGIAIAIIQDNKVVFSKGFGVKEQGKHDPVGPDTLFIIGSTTKSLTSLMISKQIELGKFSWETPVVTVLPQFTVADKDVTQKILMHHTMSASTGMPRRDSEMLFQAKDVTGSVALQQIATMKPTTALGETFQYSNHLVAIGGFAAANAYQDSGDLFDNYNAAMHELIFCPLGMKNTVVYPTEKSKKLMASAHAMDYKGTLEVIPSAIDDFVYTVAPAGSVWSNVHDMANYLIMELNEGKNAAGAQLFSQEQILKRRAPGIKMGQKETYGLGLMQWKEKKLNVVGHGGNTMGFTSELFFLPDHHIGVVMLVNAGSANGLTNGIKQKLLELLFDAKVTSDKQVPFAVKLRAEYHTINKNHVSTLAKDTQWINEFVGEYKNPDLGIITIKKVGNTFEFVTQRWTSQIGSYQEKLGDKLLALISAPWEGGFKLQVAHAGQKKLLFDAGQMKYEFVPVVKEMVCPENVIKKELAATEKLHV